MKRLCIRIRQMEDGRFYVRYYWDFWGWIIHSDHLKDIDSLTEFLKNIVTNTKW